MLPSTVDVLVGVGEMERRRRLGNQQIMSPSLLRDQRIPIATDLLVLPCGHGRADVGVTIAEVRHIPRTIQSSISGGGVVTCSRSGPPSSPAGHSACAPLTPITPRSINCQKEI